MDTRITSIVVLVIVLVASTLSISGQTEAKDRADAVRQARLAARHLQQTQDFGPLLRRYATKKFIDNARHDDLFNVFGLLDSEALLLLNSEMLESFYVEASSMIYLYVMYGCQNNNEKMRVPEDLPPGAYDLMKGRAIFSMFIGEKLPKPKTKDEVIRAISDLKNVNALFRSYMGELRDLPFNNYLTVAQRASGGDELFGLQVGKCDSDRRCGELPIGSTTVLVSFPGIYYVEFARVKGVMKIVRIYQGPGD